MNLVRVLVAAFAAFIISSLTPLNADQWNKKTILTIDQPVQLPHVVLQPGTYVFKLLDSPADRHIVQVFDKDERHLVTTILAIPNYRLQPRGKTEVDFWEVPAGQPKAMRAWFYPGDNFGQEFAYPKERSTTIEAYVKEPVPVTTAQTAEEITKQETHEEIAPPPPPAPEPPPAPVEAVPEPAPPPPPPQPTLEQVPPTPPPAPEPPAELPKTASPMPLIGLLGILSLAAFGATYLPRSR
jgi:hypothetical protein